MDGWLSWDGGDVVYQSWDVELEVEQKQHRRVAMGCGGGGSEVVLWKMDLSRGGLTKR